MVSPPSVFDRILTAITSYRTAQTREPGGLAMHPETEYELLRDSSVANRLAISGSNSGTIFGFPLVVSPSITPGAVYALPESAVDYIRRGYVQDLWGVVDTAIVQPDDILTVARPDIIDMPDRSSIAAQPVEPEPQWPPARDLDLDVEPLTAEEPETARDTPVGAQGSFIPVTRDLPITFRRLAQSGDLYSTSPLGGFSYELQMEAGQPTVASLQSAYRQVMRADTSEVAAIMSIPQAMIGPEIGRQYFGQRETVKPREGVELGGVPIPTTRQIDIIDEIDELVDDQMSNYDNRTGWDHNINQNTCPNCNEPWHGLAITTLMKEMRAIPSYTQREQALAEYNYIKDTSDVVCPGSSV